MHIPEDVPDGGGTTPRINTPVSLRKPPVSKTVAFDDRRSSNQVAALQLCAWPKRPRAMAL